MAQGVGSIDTNSFRQIDRRSRLMRRPLAYAAHARYLRDKVEGAYGVSPAEFHFLPDPISLTDQPGVNSGRPTVVFLGRLDPIKRPWLAVQAAEDVPEADFVFLGKPHFQGPGGWEIPGNPTPNVRFVGHVGEEEKATWLHKSTLLINTSIHEALPISFLEALGAGIPIVAGQDPDEVVSRFGRYVPRSEGDGCWSVPYFVDAIRDLLEKDTLRQRLGEAGQRWVRGTHSRRHFVCALQGVLRSLRVEGSFVDADLAQMEISP